MSNPSPVVPARPDIWSAIRQDLRYALRGLRSTPGFTLAVVVTLALGIGANAAMFSIVDRLLFRAPPMLHDPGLTHRIYIGSTFRGHEGFSGYLQYARYVDLTKWTSSFSRTAEVTRSDLAIGTGTASREMSVGVVSATFFGFFDAPPALGRYFAPSEDIAPKGVPLAVLGYGYWQTRYGGQHDVVGQQIQVGATTYTIVGVAPRGFVGLWPEAPPAVYIPTSVYGAESGARVNLPGEQWWTTYHWTWAFMIAQRKPGVTKQAAQADLTQAVLRSYHAAQDGSPRGQPLSITRPHGLLGSILQERGPNESSVARVATWITGVAVVVWLIACANVANLLLARALKRRREIAVRLALGVSRARLTAQLLTESVFLGLVGGLVGVLVAQWGGAILRRQLLPTSADASVVGDPRTLLVAGLAALAAGLLTGLAPLAQTHRTNLAADLKSGAREGTYSRSRLRMGLLVFQGALSVVLLVGAGLFVRSLHNVNDLSLGFDPQSVLAVNLEMRGTALDSAHAQALLEQLEAAAHALPNVTHTSRQLTIPFWSMWNMDLHVQGIDTVSKLGQFDLDAVGPDYFATMGTRILRGRAITAADVAGAPKAMVVSQAMAQVLWPGRDPIGQCVKINADTVPCTYVVGVAQNIKSESLSDDKGYFYYLSSKQWHPSEGGLFVRTTGDAASFKETLRRRLQQLMPGSSYITVTPLSDVFGQETQSWQLGATMFVVFGALALLLAAIALYSVISYNVAQRAHELGVRAALGAGVRDLARLVVSEAMVLAIAGVVLGGGLALIVARWVKPLLFNESPRDPWVFALVAGVLLAVAAVASFVPARRAAHADPLDALRSE